MKTIPRYTKAHIRKALEDEVIVGDGHTIFPPSEYEGFDISDLITTHKSDGTPKGTIFAYDGSIMEEVKGVYNLTFLYRLASDLGLEYRSCMGRGSQARAIVDSIKEWVGEEDAVQGSE